MSEKNSFHITVQFWNPAVNIQIENIVQLYSVCQNKLSFYVCIQFYMKIEEFVVIIIDYSSQICKWGFDQKLVNTS